MNQNNSQNGPSSRQLSYDEFSKKYPHATKKTREVFLKPGQSTSTNNSYRQLLRNVQQKVESDMKKKPKNQRKADDQFLRALEAEKRHIKYN